MIFRCRNGNRSDRLGVSYDSNPHFCEQFGGNSTGSDTADRLTPGRTTTSAIVTESILAVKSKVGMSGTVAGSDISVIFGALILIADN